MNRGASTISAVIVLLLLSFTLAVAQPSGTMKNEGGPKEWVPGKGWVPVESGTSNDGNYNGPGLAEAFRIRSERKRQQRQQEASEANDRGIEFAAKDDWANAIKSYQLSLAKEPNDPVVMKNLAGAQSRLANERGLTAYNNSDWASAVAFFQEALKKSPHPKNDEIFRKSLAAAQSKLQAEQARQPEKVATADMNKAITGLAEQMKTPKADTKRKTHSAGELEFITATPAAKQTPDGLEFMDASTRGAFGSKESGAKFATVAPHTTGSDTKAADQLVSAAAAAKHQGDLAINFDVGGAPSAGTLVAPTVDGRYTAVDLSHYSERAKKDPQIVTSLKGLTDLQAKRHELQAQREELIKQRDTEKDPEVMKQLTTQLDEKNTAYQANLTAITEKTDQIEKRHREIDNSGGEDAPTDNPAPSGGK